MLQRIKSSRRAVRFKLVIALGMTIGGTILNAQRPGPYGVGPVWWNAGAGGVLPWEEEYENPDGWVSILNKDGAVHTEGHPFFESLGSNHRACVTCHQPSNGMSVTPASLRDRWNETNGRDPVFAAVDGSNCPGLPQDDARSHSLLLERGLFRITVPWPPRAADGSVINPEFRIEVVRDPTGCNLSLTYGLKSSQEVISVFRRPRMPANLDYVVAGRFALMADGRESSLREQAVNAIMTHEQAEKPPADEQLRKIVDFESQVYAAQSADIRAGRLNYKGGPLLGADNLAGGKVDPLANPALLSFKVWQKQKSESDLDFQREFRASVARGAELFFTQMFSVRDASATGSEKMYTCATCHTAGSTRWMDIATTNVRPEQASPELPLFRITCDTSAPAHPVWGRIFYSQDPGRALISGKCSDVGAIVPQQLRALAARAPYFSNGSARTLREVVDFYDRQLRIGYSEQEKQDLTNFLRIL
jgi:cytochrome c peroxidase